MYAHKAFCALSAAARQLLPPGLGRDGKPDPMGADARRDNCASTLFQFAAWLEDGPNNVLPLTVAELGACYEAIGCVTRLDPKARLHALCRSLDGDPAPSAVYTALCNGMAVWQAIAAHCDRSDPRQAAIANTYCQECWVINALAITVLSDSAQH